MNTAVFGDMTPSVLAHTEPLFYAIVAFLKKWVLVRNYITVRK